MKKLTAILVFASALTLTACSTPADAGAQFREAIKNSGTSYAAMPDVDLDEMGMYICKHYAAGFTTQDLRETSGERLALAGEAALDTVCK